MTTDANGTTKIPIIFPKPTHGKGKDANGKLLKPYRTAAECIDWTIPCPSIFGRKRDLAVNTQRRIARGLDKFVIKNPQPFIMQMNFENVPQNVNEPLSTITAVNKHYVVNPSIVPIGYGERKGQAPRVNDISEPLSTVVSACKQNLVEPQLSPYIMSNNTNNAPHLVGEPLPTITTGNRNFLCCPSIIQYHSETTEKEVRGQDVQKPFYTIDTQPRYSINSCYISKYFGGDHASHSDSPLSTVTTQPKHYVMKTYLQKIDSTCLGNWDKVRKLLNNYAGYSIANDEILIIEINGAQYFISDIGMRMLKAKELMLAQGFPHDYILNIESYIGKKYSEAKQIARMGNAVCPPVAAALIRANCAEIAVKKIITTMAALNAEFESTVKRVVRRRRLV